jgi:hypothetical protein
VATSQQELDQEREHHVPATIPFFWSAELHLYIWRATGEPVTSARVRAWIDSAIASSKAWAVGRTRDLIDRRITVGTWINELRGELEAMHTALAEIAIGGSEEWGAIEANRLRTRLTQQTAYLGRLGREVESGLQKLDGTLLNRVGLFVEAGRATFEGMRRALMIDAGMTEEMRVLHSAHHCLDCPPLSGSWEPIGSLPAIGDTQCLANCACTMEYR